MTTQAHCRGVPRLRVVGPSTHHDSGCEEGEDPVSSDVYTAARTCSATVDMLSKHFSFRDRISVTSVGVVPSTSTSRISSSRMDLRFFRQSGSLLATYRNKPRLYSYAVSASPWRPFLKCVLPSSLSRRASSSRSGTGSSCTRQRNTQRVPAPYAMRTHVARDAVCDNGSANGREWRPVADDNTGCSQSNDF